MKIHSISGMIVCFFAILLLPSCDSNENENKSKQAFENYKNKRKQQEETAISSKSITTIVENPSSKELEKIELVKIEDKTKPLITNKDSKKNETHGEWLSFKGEMEKKLHGNDEKIEKIKSNPNTTPKNNRKIHLLEKNNNAIKSRIKEYNGNVKPKWEKFKTKMNEDINGIAVELNEISLHSIK